MPVPLERAADRVTRPERLLLAILGGGVVAVDTIFFTDHSLVFLVLVAALCLVAVGGSVAPYDESGPFLVLLLVLQVSLAIYIGSKGYYVLALLVGIGSFGTSHNLWKTLSEPASG